MKKLKQNFTIQSMCGRFTKKVNDYNLALIEINNKKSLFYL